MHSSVTKGYIMGSAALIPKPDLDTLHVDEVIETFCFRRISESHCSLKFVFYGKWYFISEI